MKSSSDGVRMEVASPAATANTGRLAFADGLRGVAALWVVLFHMAEGHHLDHIKAALPAWTVAILFDAGHLGVAIFFVLSGFVMALTVDQGFVDSPLAGRFVLRRLIRLAPTYYVALALALVLLYVKTHALPDARAGTSLSAVVAHVFYAQGILGYADIDAAYWTLCIEVQFYFAFALLMWATSRSPIRHVSPWGMRITLLAIVAVIMLAWPATVVTGNPWRGGFLPLWYSFLAGVLAFWGWAHRGRLRGLAVVYALAVFAIGMAREDSFAVATSLTAGALTLSSIGEGMRNWLSWRGIQFVGAISYSLYLLHNSLTGLMFRIVNRVLPHDDSATELIGMALTLATCIAVAWGCYRLIELPSIRWSRAVRLDKRPLPGRA